MQGRGDALLAEDPAPEGAPANGGNGFLRTISGGTQYSLEWTDIQFRIKDKVIINGASGNVARGEMACVLGPSGSGKTTLLNILAGRINTRRRGYEFAGRVSFNGCEVHPPQVRAAIAYVMQEDALPAMMTPRELLRMSAILRLGRAHAQHFTEQVNSLLADLRLEKCADTYVGSQLIRGISGGEKKRTAIGAELITKPKLIFLDEPLSGLDSFAAFTVVQTLMDLAHHGCLVLATVHQPSSEVFQSFDKMMCLGEGRVCYCGAVNELPQHMARVGHPVPVQYNPADHILFLIQTMPEKDVASFFQAWSEQEKQTVLLDIQQNRSSAAQIEMPGTARAQPCYVQFAQLMVREMRSTIRDKFALVMRFVVNGFTAILFACIFQGVGAKDDEVGGRQSHFGAIANIMIGGMFQSAQPLLLTFPFERPVFLREYASNMYGTVAYFISKMAIELPLSFLTCLETWLISYWIMELNGNFMGMLLASWGLSLCAASTALLMGCNIANAKAVQEMAPLVFVPQILFAGIFITIDLIPKWLQWLQYICALKYAINLAAVMEFKDLPGGLEFLAANNIREDSVGLYIGILVAIFAGFRILAVIGLRRKAAFVV